MAPRIGLAFAIALAVGCGAPGDVPVGEQTAPVVYGLDDRFEVYNHPDPELRRIAEQSVVALIPAFRLSRESNGTYSLFATPLGELRDLCPDEQFGAQPVAASCSGVLIDDDLVLTAGHCIDPAAPCGFYSYVFNYHLAASDRLAVIGDDDVYTCERVVAQEGSRSSFTPDFAIVQLDRPVEGAQVPAAIRPATALADDEQVSMIGFGSGLPAKIDSGGNVADPRAESLDFFVANVDAFQGHSGSATFDSQNRLAGILIAGREPDYEQSPGESCFRVSVYDDVEAGEVVHNVAPIVDALCNAGWESETLSGDGWLYVGNVYDGTEAPTDDLKFSLGPIGAPNGPQIVTVVDGEGGTDQGAQQLNVYSNYDCCNDAGPEGHFNGTDLVETIVFQERTIEASDIGRTYVLTFDAKAGNIGGSSTAQAFIKTRDGSDTTNEVVLDTTFLPGAWSTYAVTIDLGDAALEGQTLEFGFQTLAKDFEPSSNYYDNITFAPADGNCTGPSGPTACEYEQDFEALDAVVGEALCGNDACGGFPCNAPAQPGRLSSRAAASGRRGCSASPISTSPLGWAGLAFFVLARRLRRRAA